MALEQHSLCPTSILGQMPSVAPIIHHENILEIPLTGQPGEDHLDVHTGTTQPSAD